MQISVKKIRKMVLLFCMHIPVTAFKSYFRWMSFRSKLATNLLHSCNRQRCIAMLKFIRSKFITAKKWTNFKSAKNVQRLTMFTFAVHHVTYSQYKNGTDTKDV